MLMEVKKSLKLIGWYFKFNLSSVMEYRASFLLQSFGMILNNASFIFFWWILFSNVSDIGGYGFSEVMLLWALMSSGFGLSFILFGNIREMCKMIQQGELDTYLLQPKEPLINILSSKTVVSAWGDFLYGIILFIILKGFNIKGIMLFLLFSITAALIFASVMVTVNSLSFYTGSSEALANMVSEFLITFSIYPEGIFQGPVRVVLYSVIPTAFMVYLPAGVIDNFHMGYLLLVLAAAVSWIAIAYWMFYKGLKKYESGNLIISKL